MEQAKIAAAFVKAKREFAPALKTSINPHFKSKYADLAACIEAVDQSFLNNGIAMYQETFEDASGITVETVLLHESGEERRCGRLHVPASKNDAQAYGSALTYCRRYSLMTACGMAPEDDDGNAATKAPPKRSVEEPASYVLTGNYEAYSNDQNPPPVKQLESGSAPKIEWEKASEGKQATIRDYVFELKTHIEAENYAAVFETVESWNLDNYDKTLLWSQLPSTTRSALKRIGAAKREAAQ